jgi:hypothetical protein
MFYHYDREPDLLLSAETVSDELKTVLLRELSMPPPLSRWRYFVESLSGRMFLSETSLEKNEAFVFGLLERLKADLTWGVDQGWQSEYRLFKPTAWRIVLCSSFRPPGLAGSVMLEQRVFRKSEEMFRLWRVRD